MKRVFLVVLALGLYLTLRGYHSRDGDQAYRLPLLLHDQDPSLYAADPFVRSVAEFNPHRGSLAVIGGVGRVVGLSAALLLLFAATFAMTCAAIDRIARRVWPRSGERIGVWAVALVLIAKAGNLGTNHLFEAMLLDRLMALALGWCAIAALIGEGRWRLAKACGALAVASVVHPSLGLQLGMLLGAGCVAWGFCESGLLPVGRAFLPAQKENSEDGDGQERPSYWERLRPVRAGLRDALVLLLATLPGVAMVASSGAHLTDGLRPSEFLALSASIQSPQHMLPHLWRMPQWLAAGCYLAMAALAVAGGERSKARDRLVGLLVVDLIGLLAAWVAVEWLGSVRATVFQPFRLATVARGLGLVLMADRLRGHWDRGDLVGRLRAAIPAIGLSGDWAFVAATLFEVACTLAARFGRRAEAVGGGIALGYGMLYLSRHDTESGHLVLLGTVAGVAIIQVGSRSLGWGKIEASRPRRLPITTACAWLVPLAALIVPNVSTGRIAQKLAAHCRFGEWADSEVERLAVWCRANTPSDARFVGPPGPKTFRLWSRREVAFNRAASPYHAAGLADWSERFRLHVGFDGSITEFASAYLKDRQALERGFDRMDARALADLAREQGAGYVLASSKIEVENGPLRLLRRDGRFAVYRVEPGEGDPRAIARR